MRRSLLNAVADQAFCKLHEPLICSFLSNCNIHDASSTSPSNQQPQQQCNRGVRTKAQPDLRTRAWSHTHQQQAASAAHRDDEHDNDTQQWPQSPPPRYLQKSSSSPDRQQQQQQRSSPGSSSRTRDSWQEAWPPHTTTPKSALQHSLKHAKQHHRQDSTARSWHAYRQLQEERPEHWQQHNRSSSGRHSSRDREDGSNRNALPGSWRTAREQSAAAAAGARRGATWHGVLKDTQGSSSSSNATARQGRDSSSQSPLAVVLHSSDSTAVAPAVLTQAISSTSDLQQLQQLLTKHKDTLQQINICAAFKAVVRLSPGSSRPQSSSNSSSSSVGGESLAVMRQLSGRMLEQIRVARPWDLAQAAWACSKLQYRDARLLDSIAQQVHSKSPILLPQDIAQLASAYARLGYRHPQLMQLLQQQAMRQAAAFKPWSLIHTAWALQVSGTDPKPLLHIITQQLQPDQLAGLQPLDVATLLWLMAAHAARDATLLTAVQKQLTADIASYPPAAAAQVLISLAGLCGGITHQELARKAADAVVQDLTAQQQQQQHPTTAASRQYSPKHVTHATFALVQMGQGSQQLLDAAAAAFLSAPGGYGPGLLCMLCWAFPLAGRTPPENFTVKLVEQCLLQLQTFTADQLASILRGMLALEEPHTNCISAPQLITAACVQLPQQLQHISTPVLAKLMTTLSKQCRDRPAVQYTIQPRTEGADSQSSIALQQQEHQQEQQSQLLVLLQRCGEEWLQQRRVCEVDATQHTSVQKALRMAGLTELAAAAAAAAQAEHAKTAAAAAADEHEGDVSAAHTSPQQQRQQPLQDKLNATADDDDANAAAAAVGSGGAAGSWLDSFVATADENSSKGA